MNMVAAKPDSATLQEVLTITEALATLQVMVRSERTCDSDLIAEVDELLRALPDERAIPELVTGLLDVQQLYYRQGLSRSAIPGIEGASMGKKNREQASAGESFELPGIDSIR